MKVVVIAILVALACARMHPVNHEIVAKIKESATTWYPMEVEKNPFAYMPIEQIKGMMGTKLEVLEHNAEIDEDYTAPKDFDAREEWPGKIHEIRNQGKCGSCWAFGATEALSDRLAIRGITDVVLSPQHLVNCDTKKNMGCNGGYLGAAWDFMHKTGVVTDECVQYVSGTDGKDGECKTTCDDGSAPTYYKSNASSWSILVSTTQKEIQKNGPIEAAFSVYEDFMSYGGGVYQHKTGGLLGGHAIKCIGWGTENGVDYWLMANSWGPEWGDQGFFKIKRGDCGVNLQMTYDQSK